MQVGIEVARSTATASTPVERVDLPESDIERSVAVKVHGVTISIGFFANDALAALLVPATEFSAPSSSILAVCRFSARAVWTLSAWAVSAAGVSEGTDGEEAEDSDSEESSHEFNLAQDLINFYKI